MDGEYVQAMRLSLSVIFAVGIALLVIGLAVQYVGLRKGIKEHGYGNARVFGWPMRPWSIWALIILVIDLIWMFGALSTL
jgi:hypothetical protein